ncbi:hypothetical protein [Brevibacillus porteri]|uniref:hypothetical protein n=1 Tax=Brevibacillus porteri TaxID=2126350 RepID=UPI001FC92E7C|nr:hypothetical protein [Brevibacillus porteri]MED1799300.1 hypothetical protein [Brevibacillus porteri]MED2132312.1 hypothetical protein [Brevibacillus porteri]MED2744396.1 hypothetical protein [Brevibacillus porteri]MED2814840.1 hypothetical protein [Brevibacillus porteri]MED2895715.1 hypothetical protein [Brevibacillus porteri]
MFRKIVQSLVCLLLVMTASAVHVNVAEAKETGMLFIEKPFKKEGLRFQVTVTENDNPKYDSLVYHVAETDHIHNWSLLWCDNTTRSVCLWRLLGASLP